MKNYVAVDLGASGGRVMLAEFANGKIVLKEMHRFENGPIEENNSLHWDMRLLMNEIITGIKNAVEYSKDNIATIGVDSWGVDYGLLDTNGELIENPYHYRDSRTDGMMDNAFELCPRRNVYENTGIQFMQLNTIYQLLATKLQKPELLKKADKLIFMADLVSYFLCGEKYAEYTLASTSQLMDMRTSRWSEEIFSKLSLPVRIMPGVVGPGTVVGQLKDEICRKLKCRPIKIVAAGSHDTACAVASIPAGGEKIAYLSSGTWSLMGLEVKKPVINDLTYKYEFTNEGGVNNTIRLLKNIMGLWLVQQCRQTWKQQGKEFSYSQMTQMATDAGPFCGFVNPNDQRFLSPGDMPARVAEYLGETGQKAVEDKGQILRIIQESLAFCYRNTFDKLQEILGSSIDVLHIVGGGIQNELLCQFTADALGKKVIAGPQEATACGNVIMQAVADGEIKDIKQARKIVADSFELKQYTPDDYKSWDENYKKVVRFFK